MDESIYELIPNSNPYITGLSIVFGISTFGVSGRKEGKKKAEK